MVAWRLQPRCTPEYLGSTDNRFFFLKPEPDPPMTLQSTLCLSGEISNAAVHLILHGEHGIYFKRIYFQDTYTVKRRLAGPAQVSGQGGIRPL